MKHYCLNYFLLFSVLFFSTVASSQSKTSTCSALKQINDYSYDDEPSMKKLKKMVGKVTNDEILDYAIYLHNFLEPKNITYYDDFQRAATGENYPNQKSIEEKQTAIVNVYILPIAVEGNFRAISFLSGWGYWSSALALNFLAKNHSRNSYIKFATYELNLMNSEFGSLRFKNIYKLAEDTLLKSYFLDINRTDLLRIRDSIDNKIDVINRFNKNFDFSVSEYQSSQNYRKEAIKKIPMGIDDTSFCLSFKFAAINGNGSLSVVPIAFNGSAILYDAVSFLKVLRSSIDLILIRENPQSLAQILFDYKHGEMQNEWRFNFMNPEDQYFVNDKKWSTVIFRELSAVIPYDTISSNIQSKAYYLNRAAQLGADEAYLNLACLYQVLYYNTNLNKFNDSCIYYLEKLIPSDNPDALTLKGIKIFNGEGYIQNKEEGVKLILKAKLLGGTTATKLMETMPKKLFAGVFEGYYYKQSVNVIYPWDFKVLCSNGCGKYTYPDKIIFGRLYNNDSNFPQIIRAEYFIDGIGNPILYVSDNDFKNTFTIAHMGYTDWKHVMCSGTCQLAHENKNNSHWDEIKKKREQIDNEEIRCVACGKVMRRKDMVTIPECPCITNDNSSINISFTQSNDIYGDKEPKACSAQCQIDFCNKKCVYKGYRVRK